MKRLGGYLLAVLITATLLPMENVAAAACANVSSFGAIRLNLPEIKKTENRSLWVRMQSANVSDKILAEINGNECLEVDIENVGPNQWAWQSPDSLIKLRADETNSITLIGVNSGVKIDRVLLTEEGCIPQDFGNNCQKAVELTTYGPATTVLPSPSNKPVSGKVILSPTPKANQSNLKELKYSINGGAVQVSSAPDPFDTTLIENGKYTVLIQTTLSSGEIINESTTLEISNPENDISPVVRFVRANQHAIKRIAVVLGAVLILFGLLKLFTYFRRSRRERSFHGF